MLQKLGEGLAIPANVVCLNGPKGITRSQGVSASFACRLFFTLQTIVPPIVLTLIGFACILIPQRDFTDRLKTLVSVLFPTFVVQFTITNTLPRTSTLLSPQYLVFISIIEIAMLIAVAGITSLILNRRTNFIW